MCGTDLILGILALIFPPVAVWIKRGICSADSLINICLCVLGFLPGLAHAWYIILKFPDPTYDRVPQDDVEAGTSSYQHGQRHPGPSHPQLQPQAHRDYGSINQAGPSQGLQGSHVQHTHAHSETPPSYADAVKGDYKVQNP